MNRSSFFSVIVSISEAGHFCPVGVYNLRFPAELISRLNPVDLQDNQSN
jgi:hypothetical protein